MNTFRSSLRALGPTAALATFALVLGAGCLGGGEDDSDLGSTTQAAQAKVTICHRGETISVAEPAVPAHLRHGDTLGPCDAGVADAGVDAGAVVDAGGGVQ